MITITYYGTASDSLLTEKGRKELTEQVLQEILTAVNEGLFQVGTPVYSKSKILPEGKSMFSMSIDVLRPDGDEPNSISDT